MGTMKANADDVLSPQIMNADKCFECGIDFKEAKQQLADGLVALKETIARDRMYTVVIDETGATEEREGKEFIDVVPVDQIYAYFGIGRNHG